MTAEQFLFWYGLTLSALLGACFGSFINVVAHRWPKGASVVSPPSHCPSCGHALTWWHNIPLVSFIMLRGQCGFCRTRISSRYFWVEAATALLFAGVLLRFGLSFEVLKWIPLAAVGVTIVLLDWDHWWIPDALTYPAMMWALLCTLLPNSELSLTAAVIGLGAAALAWLVRIVFHVFTGKEGLGLGDVKLLAVVGLATGLASSIAVLFWAAIQAVVVGSIWLHLRGEQSPTPSESSFDDEWVPPSSAVPFGPFLVLAMFEVVLVPSWFRDGHLRLTDLLASWIVG